VGRLPKSPSDGFETASAVAELRSDLLPPSANFIYRLLREGKITDEARRCIERELDLEEAAIACRKRAEWNLHSRILKRTWRPPLGHRPTLITPAVRKLEIRLR
jgi:hypothetical protein